MSSIAQSVKKLPAAPGVYFFRGAKGKILYIGKATSLRNRVRSYFNGRILETRGPLIGQLIGRAKTVMFQKTDSVLEALMLEAYLIKKHQPPYNTDSKDDKSFNHVVITKEDFPRVLVVRGKDLAEGNRQPTTDHQRQKKKELKTGDYRLQTTYGPFPHGTSLKEALRLVRKIFPFRDTCVPFIKSRAFDKDFNTLGIGKPCFNAQIGLCPGVCSGAISKKEYAKTIRNIKSFFEGKKKTLVAALKRDMRAYAKRQEFEKAASVRRTLFALQHIQDIALIKRELRMQNEEVPAFRIEAYDVAHISGTGTVGVFTVVEDGRAKKSDYRMFRIRRAAKGSDTGALAEVLERRLRHAPPVGGWLLPQLIAVDGGVAQKNAAERILRSAGLVIPVVAVVKDERHRPREILGEGNVKHVREREILLANSEAHRFAVNYHRRIRGR